MISELLQVYSIVEILLSVIILMIINVMRNQAKQEIKYSCHFWGSYYANRKEAFLWIITILCIAII